MAQSNTSIFNKTGYSMFWSSMWDSKNSYCRNYKEDVLLRIFFKLSFNDSLSVNTILLNKNKELYKKYTSIPSLKNQDLYKYYFNLNKIVTYPSKIWILKYQNWLVIYNFVFVNKFSKNNLNNFSLNDDFGISNFFYVYNNFLKTNRKNKIFFNLNKNFVKTIF